MMMVNFYVLWNFIIWRMVLSLVFVVGFIWFDVISVIVGESLVFFLLLIWWMMCKFGGKVVLNIRNEKYMCLNIL